MSHLDDFQKKNGRMPNEQEFDSVAKEVALECALIVTINQMGNGAKKPASDDSKPNLQ